MLSRILEPEVMDTAEEAEDYDSMDHSHVNRLFVEDWHVARTGSGPTLVPQDRILDVGTGTALIPIEFCRRFNDLKIVAIDLAVEMLKLAERNIRQAGFGGQIEIRLVDAKRIPAGDGEFAGVVSNSIIHHIPEPRDCFFEMVRVLKPGGLLFVRDLMRPRGESELEHLVQTYAGDATPRQRQLFRQSLHAALTVQEVTELLQPIPNLSFRVAATSDRHWSVIATRK